MEQLDSAAIEKFIDEPTVNDTRLFELLRDKRCLAPHDTLIKLARSIQEKRPKLWYMIMVDFFQNP